MVAMLSRPAFDCMKPVAHALPKYSKAADPDSAGFPPVCAGHPRPLADQIKTRNARQRIVTYAPQKHRILSDFKCGQTFAAEKVRRLYANYSRLGPRLQILKFVQFLHRGLTIFIEYNADLFHVSTLSG